MAVSVFCFGSWSGGPSITTNPKDAGVFLSISSEGWTIRADERAKLKRAIRPVTMEQGCSEGTCISYSRKCDSAEHPTQCDYLVEVAGSLHTVSLKADDEAHARIAMDNFAIMPAEVVSRPGQTLPSNVVLAEFSKEAAAQP